MTLDSIVKLLNKQLIATGLSSLSQVEILLLQGIWNNVTYSEIGQQQSYSPGYLTKVAAPKLYKKLSTLLGEDVSKKNCRLLLMSYLTSVDSKAYVSYPSGAVALNSSFYIERPSIEAKIYQELARPGALIRIKGSRGMGKTSLLLRVIDCALSKDYNVVSFNLAQIDSELFKDLNRFLRFICVNASQQLDREAKLDNYWDEDIGSKVSCSLYFRYHLLEQSDRPIVLAFDKLDLIFEHPELARDFLPLLRSWYEEGKRTSCWQKLRMVTIYTTEITIPLSVNLSPCNVGLPIELMSFDNLQVNELARKYQLDWQNNQNAELLNDFVGGHPELIHVALYHLSRQEVTLTEILATASNPGGIYYNHLLRHWLNLQQAPQLARYFNSLLAIDTPLSLEPIAAYKLRGMGLIKPIGDCDIVSCQLYRNYFTQNSLTGSLENS
ncbi:MAG: AAA-like domain-containing protein [Cyanobacteria bacterium J06623_7]